MCVKAHDDTLRFCSLPKQPVVWTCFLLSSLFSTNRFSVKAAASNDRRCRPVCLSLILSSVIYLPFAVSWLLLPASCFLLSYLRHVGHGQGVVFRRLSISNVNPDRCENASFFPSWFWPSFFRKRSPKRIRLKALFSVVSRGPRKRRYPKTTHL